MARKKRGFCRLCAALLGLMLLPVGAWATQPDQAAPVLGIYTTGDMAGRVYETDPLTGVEEESGYLKVAAAMTEEREQVESALLLDSGDAVANDLASGSAADTALALRAIGYDALVPSVEEFRLGQGHRAAFFRDLTRTEGEGTPVELLSADWLDGKTGQPAAQPYQIFTRQLGGKGIRIAVVGLGTLEVPESLPAYYYSDSRFGHLDDGSGNYAWEWNRWVQPQLARENCDLVVVCCHGDLDTLEQFAAETAGIDLLVGGHGVAGTGVLRDRDSQAVPWVSGGGTALTRTDVTLSPEGKPVIGSSQLLELSGYENDMDLAQAVAPGQAARQNKAGQRTGALSGDWSDAVADLLRQTPVADLVARAMLWTSGADAALVTNGSLGSLPEQSDAGLGVRTFTLRDCARLATGNSPVVVVELTGAQLEGWLDICAGRYQVDEAGQLTGGGDADFLYGMN